MIHKSTVLYKLHSHTESELIQTGVYTITSKLNGKIYVGSTANTYSRFGTDCGFQARWTSHVSDLRLNKHHNKHLQNHVNKYSINDLKFEILDFYPPEYCASFELYWVNVLDAVNTGFNLIYPLKHHYGKSHPKYRHIDTESLISGYCNDLKSIGQLANEFHISDYTVLRRLRSNNIEVRTNKIDYLELYKDYLNSSMNIDELSKKHNLAFSSVFRGFKKEGFLLKTQIARKDIYLIHKRFQNGESLEKKIALEYDVDGSFLRKTFEALGLDTKVNRVIKTDVIKSKIEDLYLRYSSGESTIETIAKQLNVDPTLVRQIFNKHGFKIRYILSKVSPIEEDVYDIYISYLKGTSINKVLAPKYKVTHSVIHKAFKKFNLKQIENVRKEKIKN
jgi:hypothetical protein